MAMFAQRHAGHGSILNPLVQVVLGNAESLGGMLDKDHETVVAGLCRRVRIS